MSLGIYIPLLLLVIDFGGIYSIRSCYNYDDCKFIHECPNAQALQSNPDTATIQTFRNAHCASIKIRGVNKPKFCCSDFPEPETENRNAGSTDDNIENHPNIELLPENCGPLFLKDRIVGGNYAEMYEYPWMALIMYKTSEGRKFECAGSIINNRYILTAAHCVRGKDIVYVRLGEYDLKSKRDCQGKYESYVCESHLQNIKVEKAIIHKDYNKIKRVNDIALLRLKKFIDIKDHNNVKPICLPLTKELRDSNLYKKQATVAGWGATEYNKRSHILRKVEIPIWTESQCMNSEGLSENESISILCAGIEGKDSCSGDSGGPLMLEKDYRGRISEVQFGIVSYGTTMCGQGKPGIYTDVTKYVDWILDNIEA